MPLLLRISNCKGHVSKVKSGYFRKQVNSDRDFNTFYMSGFWGNRITRQTVKILMRRLTRSRLITVCNDMCAYTCCSLFVMICVHILASKAK